ncbi:MAG TPA: DUF3795 domain-containing protein [Firmicutes bacterium]|jgi:hypothetical protein|nr:DUF3795 domain-containing protein [Bacillota bacterium]HOQ24158.1 DUF3795 domain-containing protein [Bacillota bacterium]HPT67569.1 DUF3795 domain-containing protein [Bacillota bacterium]
MQPSLFSRIAKFFKWFLYNPDWGHISIRSSKVLLSRCGYRCDLCPAFEENMYRGTTRYRKSISRGWAKYFGIHIAPDKIICCGCLKDGLHLDKCCPVRPCVIKNAINNCAECVLYPCGKIRSRMEYIEEVKAKWGKIPWLDRRRFIRPYESRQRLEQLRKRKT